MTDALAGGWKQTAEQYVAHGEPYSPLIIQPDVYLEELAEHDEAVRQEVYATVNLPPIARDRYKAEALTEFIETYRHSSVLWLPDLVRLLESTAVRLRTQADEPRDLTTPTRESETHHG